MHSSIKVKICGLRRPGDVEVCVAAGADMIGLNLWPGSKRHITFEKAREWLPDFESQIARVAVLVRPEWEFVVRIVQSGCFDWVQLHGEEPPEFVNQVVGLGLPVIYAIKTEEKKLNPNLADAVTCQHFLLDSAVGNYFGGTGHRIAEKSLIEALTCYQLKSLFIAGGLRPSNVGQVARLPGVDGVDTAGGVEVSPGIKSSPAIHAFVEAARQQ